MVWGRCFLTLEGISTLKLMSIILSFAILFTGCYSNTTVTKDTPLPPPTVQVRFRLNDGTYILPRLSFNNQRTYQRLENGWHIIGELVQPDKSSQPFEGIVRDEQIMEVIAPEYDAGKTFMGIALGVGVIVGIVVIVAAATYLPVSY